MAVAVAVALTAAAAVVVGGGGNGGNDGGSRGRRNYIATNKAPTINLVTATRKPPKAEVSCQRVRQTTMHEPNSPNEAKGLAQPLSWRDPGKPSRWKLKFTPLEPTLLSGSFASNRHLKLTDTYHHLTCSWSHRQQSV